MKVFKFTFLCLSLIFLSDSAAFFVHLFICFDEVLFINECSFVNQLSLKIAGVEGRTLAVFNGCFL